MVNHARQEVEIKYLECFEFIVHTIDACFEFLGYLLMQETLTKAQQIFGTENKDLYLSFHGLLYRRTS